MKTIEEIKNYIEEYILGNKTMTTFISTDGTSDNDNLNKIMDKIVEKQSTEKQSICLSPEHNPPMHLYIAPGQWYTHKCPACGKEIKIMGSGALY